MRSSFELLGRPEGRSSRIEEICNGAGVSRATFYNYFSSVEELFQATAFDISHDFNDAVRAVLRRVPGGAIRLAFALRYNLHQGRRDPPWGWALINLSVGGPIFGDEAARFCMETLEEGIMSEQFRAPNLSVAFDLVTGTALASMVTLLRKPQPENYPELVVAQLFQGLGVSETLIRKSISTDLPDPFEYSAVHGLGTADNVLDGSIFT
ncbi:MAG: TetR/AcrR family transcriptional regulator [Sphingobium sp.]|uniref:TetR/AcrR family transcriptional regulator n=1 Tax=Sphingobium sp. TaxID=1912891 RepID=UPI0029B883C0|nr:TetR/AcrR family transcriptional regulator [Sphingobium sp.]MDX3910853.1 TetR/AcrR family transcriptional regulator [Sphingobium sp.]